MKSAIITNGVVGNIIVGDIDGSVPCGDEVGIGWGYDGDLFLPPPPPPLSPEALEAVKSDLKRSIDAAAEAERLRYITPGAGQAMTYSQKADEARRCIDAIGPDAADYPLLAAEIGITAGTLVGVAQVIAAANAQWLQIGAAIEAARLSTKMAIAAAETEEAARAAAAAVVWP